MTSKPSRSHDRAADLEGAGLAGSGSSPLTSQVAPLRISTTVHSCRLPLVVVIVMVVLTVLVPDAGAIAQDLAVPVPSVSSSVKAAFEVLARKAGVVSAYALGMFPASRAAHISVSVAERPWAALVLGTPVLALRLVGVGLTGLVGFVPPREMAE